MSTVLKFPDGAPGIGHNLPPPPSFEDELDTVLKHGTLVLCLETLKLAIYDKRTDERGRQMVTRNHLMVLARLADFMTKGLAWPSRELLGEPIGLPGKIVGDLLYDLRLLGYVRWERRSTLTERGPRKLVNYLFSPSGQEEITKAVKALREKLNETTAPAPYSPATTAPAGYSELQRPRSTSPAQYHAGVAGTTAPDRDRNLIQDSKYEEVVVVARASDLVQIEEPTPRSQLATDLFDLVMSTNMGEVASLKTIASLREIYTDQLISQALMATRAEPRKAPYKYFLKTVQGMQANPPEPASGQISGSGATSRNGRVNVHKASKEAF